MDILGTKSNHLTDLVVLFITFCIPKHLQADAPVLCKSPPRLIDEGFDEDPPPHKATDGRGEAIELAEGL